MKINKITFGARDQFPTITLLERLRGLRERAAPSPVLAEAFARTQRGLETLAALDRRHGSSGPIPVEGVEALATALLTDLAGAESEALRASQPDVPAEIAHLLIGVSVWAVRHEVVLEPVGPIVNALARRANAARTKPELAAVFGLTQGILLHVAPRLAADLERSDPERPWRILHANLAITAIRTEDASMMDCAFDALDAALPEERAGFYAEALALALAPGIAPEVRERIGARHLKWTAAR